MVQDRDSFSGKLIGNHMWPMYEWHQYQLITNACKNVCFSNKILALARLHCSQKRQ